MKTSLHLCFMLLIFAVTFAENNETLVATVTEITPTTEMIPNVVLTTVASTSKISLTTKKAVVTTKKALTTTTKKTLTTTSKVKVPSTTSKVKLTTTTSKIKVTPTKTKSKVTTTTPKTKVTTKASKTTTEKINAIQNISGNALTNITTQRIPTQVQHTTRRPILQGLRSPCSCLDGQCGCCTGAVLDRLQQKICLNFTYDPDDFALTTSMTMNKRVLFKNTVSGKNPPPVCVRAPRLNFIRLCVQFSNIYFASRNMHMCIDMAANWESVTLIEWSFDCIRMGAAGVAVVRPEEGGALPPSQIGNSEDEDEEDYDDNARNIPKPAKNEKTVIFDPGLKALATKTPNKKDIRVRITESGNIKISPKKQKYN